jgi:hypothetical protein
MITRNKELLHELILDIVNDNSGGIKFIALMTEVIFRIKEGKANGFREIPDDLDIYMEEIIRESKDMKILDYTWTKMKRAKMFVYTPNPT